MREIVDDRHVEERYELINLINPVKRIIWNVTGIVFNLLYLKVNLLR